MDDVTCLIADCDKPRSARGMCGMHLQRDYRAKKRWPRSCEACGETFLARWHGTRFCSDLCRGRNSTGAVPASASLDALPSDAVAITRSIAGAFAQQDWDAVLEALRRRVKHSDGCWLWLGAVDDRGYGRLTLNGRRMLAHRVAAIAKNRGDVGPLLQAHHTCARPACCNPDHLQVVSQAENTAEMLERHRYQRRIAALESALADLDPEHPLIFGH